MIENSIVKKVGGLPGKTIALFAGVHGNEKVGVMTLDKLEKELLVKAGTLFLVYGNPPAIEADKRQLAKNLNRLFSQDPERSVDDSYEDTRAAELMKLLDECNAVLDIHSYNSLDGKQFAFCEPNGYDIIKKMDFPIVVSRLDPDPKMYSKTVMGYMNRTGKIGITIECGTSNKAEEFLPIALKSCYQFLQHFEMIDPIVPNDQTSQQIIKSDRAYYMTEKGFRFVKDFKDFEPLSAGEIFAWNGDEPLIAGEDECIYFPRPNALVGAEACLIGKFV